MALVEDARTVESKICPKCNAVIPADYVYCPTCAARPTAPVAQQQVIQAMPVRTARYIREIALWLRLFGIVAILAVCFQVIRTIINVSDDNLRQENANRFEQLLRGEGGH